jgi:ABC-2 type transport system permease protein
MNRNVIKAIFKRNFISYFSSPTGYVFICVFVLLGSIAAFWPYEFFNANLANLDQLNKYLPLILLFFIPAITMSIWSDERRLGTDELLLTIPAGDVEVVLGKYLAAIAIYTVSLLFSLLCNSLVLFFLGEPDFGLLLGNYFGYWTVGLAMIGIGMAASFLTSNLTVAFILGALFNLPLVFAAFFPDRLAFLRDFSIAEQFRDFGRGVISLSSVGYFVGIALLMLYGSVILIGRRHWRGGSDGHSMAAHYAVRFVSLLLVVVAANVFLTNHNRLRLDVTAERLSSLSPQTVELIQNLDSKQPIKIEAYVSPEVPENYVQTKLNLLSTLQELDALGGDKIELVVRTVEPFSEAAVQAEQQYEIRPQRVQTRSRGAQRAEEVFLGVAFTSGLERTKIPFLDKGLPVEYELVRSIATVSQQKRKKIGIVTTDAKLFGSFDMQSMAPPTNQMIVEELQKQYDVTQVDANSPISDEYDVLLAVQPSSLAQQQMDNFIAAVKRGVPTAIFEDPFPQFFPDVAGTAAPKMPPGGMNPFMMRQQPPTPKGNITPLWQMLGVDFSGDQVVWQDYNPIPKLAPFMTREWVFAGPGSGADQAFNVSTPATSSLQQVLFVFPGAITHLNSSTMKFTPLVSTSERTGVVPANQILDAASMFGGQRINPDLPLLERPTGSEYILAARIQGNAKETLQMSDKSAEVDDRDAGPGGDTGSSDTGSSDTGSSDTGSSDTGSSDTGSSDTGSSDTGSNGVAGSDLGGSDASGSGSALPPGHPPLAGTSQDPGASKPTEKKSGPVNVILVSDIDCLYSAFFMIRARGEEEGVEDQVNLDFDNVTFILNTLDTLADDDRFVPIRSRRPAHRVLTKVNLATEAARKQADDLRKKYNDKFEAEKKAAQKKLDDQLASLREKQSISIADAQQLQFALQKGQDELNTINQRLKSERDKELKRTEGDLNREIRRVQDNYKTWAALLPPIPPLLVGLFVLFKRRAAEQEGVNKSRLR